MPHTLYLWQAGCIILLLFAIISGLMFLGKAKREKW